MHDDEPQDRPEQGPQDQPAPAQDAPAIPAGYIDPPDLPAADAGSPAEAARAAALTALRRPAPAYDGPPIDPDTELYDEQGEITTFVWVEGRTKPFLIGAFPPRMLDEINLWQERARPGHPLPDQVVWESRIVAAALRGTDGVRRYRTIEQVIAKAEEIADRMLPGYVKVLFRKTLDINKFGQSGSYDALKNGSGATGTGSTSSPSGTDGASGPSSSGDGKAPSGG